MYDERAVWPWREERKSDAELTAEVLDEGIDPDGLYRKLGLVLNIEFAPPLGVAKIHPVCCFVAGPAKKPLNVLPSGTFSALSILVSWILSSPVLLLLAEPERFPVSFFSLFSESFPSREGWILGLGLCPFNRAISSFSA